MELRLGAVGDEVSAYKKDLIILGYPLNDAGPNKGAFGQKVYWATIDFQKKNNLTPDGWAGPLTRIAIRRKVAEKLGGIPALPTTPGKTKPNYWKPGPYHPLFIIPEGYTHLHPQDILFHVRGEREILGSRDNPLIAHFHEHSGNLGLHSDQNDYHDEVPHCMSAWNWACDGAGCYKTDNALASSGLAYPKKYGAKTYKKGDWVEKGAALILDGHITSANRRFLWSGKGSVEGFGSNQGNTIKSSTYPQSRIKAAYEWVPKPGTVLAPIGSKPVPSTGSENESTR